MVQAEQQLLHRTVTTLQVRSVVEKKINQIFKASRVTWTNYEGG